jgi:hypothetical protein
MSNVYKHKNCLKLNLWNCNWDNKLPELDGHVTVIFNIITTEFRIWLRSKCINNVWTKNKEIISYPEKIRQYVIKQVYRRLQENCFEQNVTGAREIGEISDNKKYHIDDIGFIRTYYVGDYDAKIAILPNQFELRYKVDRPYFPPFKRRPDFVTVSRSRKCIIM